MSIKNMCDENHIFCYDSHLLCDENHICCYDHHNMCQANHVLRMLSQSNDLETDWAKPFKEGSGGGAPKVFKGGSGGAVSPQVRSTNLMPLRRKRHLPGDGLTRSSHMLRRSNLIFDLSGSFS